MLDRFAIGWTLGILAVCLAVFPGATALAGDGTAAADAELDKDYPRATLPEATSGKDTALVDLHGCKATVMLCMSLECPISNEYVPTINAIAKAYQDKGVSFFGIDPNGGETLEAMAAYAEQQKLPFPFVKDAGGKVSRRLLYSVTPEARVFDSSGKLVYSGRIDDRYRRGGTSDKNVARDLEKALDEVLAGEPVSQSRTKAIGCPIQVGVPRSAN